MDGDSRSIKDTLKSVSHLVRYSFWAYQNDGPEFRANAKDLSGTHTKYRTLSVETPFLKDKLTNLTPNTRVHLGIRGETTLVLVFSGIMLPYFPRKNLDYPERWLNLLGIAWMYMAFGLTNIDWSYRDHDLSDVLVQEGFLYAFNKLRESLKESIKNLTEDKTVQPFQNIEVCGHGFGGALATLCALWCKFEWLESNITCVTLGSPRVGNINLKKQFQKHNINFYRLVLDSDPIPTLLDRYTEIIPVRIPASNPSWHIRERKYQHIGTPIWLHESPAMIPFQLRGQPSDIAREEKAKPFSATTKHALLRFIILGWHMTLFSWNIAWLFLRAPQATSNIRKHWPTAYAKALARVPETGSKPLDGWTEMTYRIWQQNAGDFLREDSF